MSVEARSTAGRRLLAEHVADFNAGVRTGEFGPMTARMTDDARMIFVGVPVGPFEGRQAIADAYRREPPDDTLTIIAVREGEGEVVADYAWDRRPGVRAGEFRLQHDGAQICSLAVTFADTREGD